LRKFRAAVAVALTLLFCGTAVAETFTDFPTVIKNKRNATEPELDSGYVPLTTGDAKDTRKIPAGEITRNSAVQTLTNKNINCLENNCTNFPGGTGGGGGPGGMKVVTAGCKGGDGGNGGDGGGGAGGKGGPSIGLAFVGAPPQIDNTAISIALVPASGGAGGTGNTPTATGDHGDPGQVVKQQNF